MKFESTLISRGARVRGKIDCGTLNAPPAFLLPFSLLLIRPYRTDLSRRRVGPYYLVARATFVGSFEPVPRVCTIRNVDRVHEPRDGIVRDAVN